MLQESLTKLFNDCEDEGDPTCMERILSLVDKVYAEDEDFINILIHKLSGLSISWEQPWYQQSNCLTRNFKEFPEGEGEPFLTDKIIKDENDLIDANWKEFVQEYNIPNKPLCFARWRQKDHTNKKPMAPAQHARHFAVCYLARGLKRTLPQVYKHFISKHAYPRRGAFHIIEERVMDICFYHEPKFAALYLSAILGRDARAIYNRQKMSKGFKPVKMRVKWTLGLATELLNNLIKHTDTKLKKLRHKSIERNIWQKIEEEMGIPYYNIRYFWLDTLHPQIFIQEDVKIKSLRRKIFKMLRNSHYKIWRDIRWQEVVTEFPKGYTTNFIHKVSKATVRYVPDYSTQPLQHVAHMALNILKNTKTNQRLRRLKQNENGVLEVIKLEDKHIKNNQDHNIG